MRVSITYILDIGYRKFASFDVAISYVPIAITPLKESKDQQITDLQMTIVDMYEMRLATMGLTE